MCAILKTWKNIYFQVLFNCYLGFFAYLITHLMSHILYIKSLEHRQSSFIEIIYIKIILIYTTIKIIFV